MTDQMKRKLAKQYAQVRGYVGKVGGWIYSPNGKPVAQGWAAFADQLVASGRISNGHINWMLDHR